MKIAIVGAGNVGAAVTKFAAPVVMVAYGWKAVANYWAIAIAVITGTMLASHENRWSDFALQLKLGFVVLVGVLIWWHMKRPGNHVLEGAIFVVSLIIVWLGVTLVLD